MDSQDVSFLPELPASQDYLVDFHSKFNMENPGLPARPFSIKGF
jgi:hypothetical protein